MVRETIKKKAVCEFVKNHKEEVKWGALLTTVGLYALYRTGYHNGFEDGVDRGVRDGKVLGEFIALLRQ